MLWANGAVRLDRVYRLTYNTDLVPNYPFDNDHPIVRLTVNGMEQPLKAGVYKGKIILAVSGVWVR